VPAHLAGVGGVEECKEGEDEALVNHAPRHLGFRLRGGHELEEELVDELEVRPGGLEAAVAEGGVDGRAGAGEGNSRREGAEEVGGDHRDEGAGRLVVAAHGARGDRLQELAERLALELLLGVEARLPEVEYECAEAQLAQQ
jgi:hypothetical protein